MIYDEIAEQMAALMTLERFDAWVTGIDYWPEPPLAEAVPLRGFDLIVPWAEQMTRSIAPGALFTFNVWGCTLHADAFTASLPWPDWALRVAGLYYDPMQAIERAMAGGAR